MKITAELLCSIIVDLPCQKAFAIVDPLDSALLEADISTPLRLSHFLAQLCHESGGFKFTKELGAKSYFDRYEGREDLGNDQPGDGYRYRGRGWIMITGRANYKAAGEALGLQLEAQPELAEIPRVAARIAAWYWNLHKVNEKADENDINAVTKKINGGLNGLRSRKLWFTVIEPIVERYCEAP